jgi:hypothetical protein
LYALRTWSRFKPADMAAVLWALAVLKAPTPDMWRLLHEKLALAPMNAFSDAELTDIYAAYLLLDQSSAALRPPSRRVSIRSQIGTRAARLALG